MKISKFFDKFCWKLTYFEGNIKIFEKNLKDFEKNSRLLKKTQCYGVGLTQSDSIKSVKKMPGLNPAFLHEILLFCKLDEEASGLELIEISEHTDWS